MRPHSQARTTGLSVHLPSLPEIEMEQQPAAREILRVAKPQTRKRRTKMRWGGRACHVSGDVQTQSARGRGPPSAGCIILRGIVEVNVPTTMGKRALNLVRMSYPFSAICESCRKSFTSRNEDSWQAETEIKAAFDKHKCEPHDATPGVHGCPTTE